MKASPLARRIAADAGVDLHGVSGSGPGGRIIKVDVEAAAESGAAVSEVAPARTSAPAEGNKGQTETVELSRIQRTIARRMAESKATIPHFYLRTEVDMDRAMAVRAAFKAAADDGPVPSLNDIVVKATAMALREFPRANGGYRDETFELHSRVNVGIAVATDDALIVPVIADADRKSLREIGAESRKLAERVRTGEITPPELAGGTFTVSNLGMFGVHGFDAVINPGQAGILAVGQAVERPVVRDGEYATAPMLDLSLACDHRILYGADGARFLAAIKAGLEEPGMLA
ncbi:MAG: 2-oxo acid dehydrogenase subunit E2 [Actinomycetota bacterium]|nr:2-oxo acid dehydrogenase subunit E2 [Actinomycetota bacterium]